MKNLVDKGVNAQPPPRPSPGGDGGAFLELVLGGLREGVTVHAADGALLFANRAASALLRLQPGVGGAIDLGFTDDLGRAVPVHHLPHELARRERRPIFDHLRLSVPGSGNGHGPWVEITATPVGDPDLPMVVTTWHDASDVRDVQRQLLFHQAVMEAQREASPAGIVACSTEGQILYWNTRFAELFNLQEWLPGSAPSRAVFEHVLTRVADPDRLREATLDLRFDQQTRIPDLEVELAEGRTLELHSSPLALPQGEWLGRAWFFRDVTTRKAREAWERRFVGMAAHELRNPLHTIQLTSQLMVSHLTRARCGCDGCAFAVERLRTVIRTTGQMDRLIGRLLDVTALRNEAQQLELEEVDLAALARNVVDAHQAVLARAHLQVRVETTDVRCVADAARVVQLLENLLTNAIKYGRGAPILIQAWQEDGTARLSVQDGGEGIPAAEHQRIFEAFHRVRSGPAQPIPGLGLGLYVVQRIVEAHGGRVEVRSPPEGGTEFTVVLPLEGPSVPQLSGARSPS